MIPRQLAVLAALLSAGCTTDGTIAIQNETGTELTGSLDGRGFVLSGFESIEFSLKVGTRVLVFGPGSKDVTFEGESCTSFPFERTVTVQRSDVTNVAVLPDAVCVTVSNQGKFPVDQVFIREHGSTEWGGNRIAGDRLESPETVRFRYEPGRYDFLLVDVCGDSTLVVEGDSLARGTIEWVTHRGQDSCPGP